VDSVIDGLDGMVLNNYGFITSYNTVVTPSVDNNVEACSAKIVNKIDFSDEIALGRDFDQQKISNVWTGNISVTANAAGNGDEAHIDITNAGNTVRAFSGSIETAEEQMTDDIDSFLNYIAKQKTAALLAGQDPDNYQMQSLADLVGTDNITTSGYFDGTVTINSNMTLSDGTIGYTPGYVGRTYPTAYIDFKNITDLSSLDELGFNSTCKTCNNHYSIVFKNSLNSSYTTSEGYGYNFSSQGQNYTLEIDLDSLSRNGVNDGAGIANAIVSIASDAFDFHYTQYAAEGSKLYVFDDRASTAVATYATFDTDPYTAVYEGVYDVNLSSDDGNYINLNYNYNFRDSQSQVKVAMVEDADGSYVKNADGSYSLYTPPADPTTATNVVRYNIQTSFTDTNGNLTSRSDAAASYAKAAVNKMLTNTSVSLNALDYTYTKMRGNEKSNVAIRAEYDSKMVMSPYVNGITIKHSSGMDDFTFISRFPMNTLTMGLSKAGCKTIEQAEKTLDYVKTASRYVSEKRSLYGAYQNRLEHTYNNNYNIEENTTAAESRIRDTDMAAEMVQLSKENILEQVGQAIMSQANQSNQGVLELLR
jgi:flagellin-like hook-associated protein FlgL